MEKVTKNVFAFFMMSLNNGSFYLFKPHWLEVVDLTKGSCLFRFHH